MAIDGFPLGRVLTEGALLEIELLVPETDGVSLGLELGPVDGRPLGFQLGLDEHSPSTT